MKKLVLMLIVLTIVLSGCSSQPKKTVEGWALHYAKEAYYQDYPDYVLIAYSISEYTVIVTQDFDEELQNAYCKMFKIVFVEDSGKNVVYDVFIAYGNKKEYINGYLLHFSEDKIIDVDMAVIE